MSRRQREALVVCSFVFGVLMTGVGIGLLFESVVGGLLLGAGALIITVGVANA